MTIEDLEQEAAAKAKAEAKPKRERAPRSTSKAVTPSLGLEEIQEQLTEFYVFLGLTISPFARASGSVLMERSDRMAQSWVIAAKRNPKIKKRIEAALSTSAMGGVVIAHFGLVVAMAKDFRILPSDAESQLAFVDAAIQAAEQAEQNPEDAANNSG